MNLKKHNHYKKADFFIFLCITSFCSFVFLWSVSSSFSNFFDFYVYNDYILNGTYLARFAREPVSAFLMHTVNYFNFSADFYYFICVLFFLLCMQFFSWSYFRSSWGIFFFGLFLFNPSTLILIQTPRYLLAFSFFVLATSHLLKSQLFYVIIFLILSILSHTAGGLISLAFLSMFLLRPVFQYFALVLSLLIFYVILQGGSEFFEMYATYEGTEHDRGFGRLLVAIFSFCFSVFLFRGASQFRYFLYILMATVMAMFLMTPYAHRIFTYIVFFSFLYFCSNANSNYFRYLALLILSIFIFSFSFIILNSMYGY